MTQLSCSTKNPYNMQTSKRLNITLCDSSTGEILGKCNKDVLLCDSTPLSSSRLLHSWIDSLIRGAMVRKCLALSIVLEDFTPPVQQNIF